MKLIVCSFFFLVFFFHAGLTAVGILMALCKGDGRNVLCNDLIDVTASFPDVFLVTEPKKMPHENDAKKPKNVV